MLIMLSKSCDAKTQMAFMIINKLSGQFTVKNYKKVTI